MYNKQTIAETRQIRPLWSDDDPLYVKIVMKNPYLVRVSNDELEACGTLKERIQNETKRWDVQAYQVLFTIRFEWSWESEVVACSMTQAS